MGTHVQPPSHPQPGFRLDVPLQSLLQPSPAAPHLAAGPAALPASRAKALPEPPFPRHPELLAGRERDLDDSVPHVPPAKRSWKTGHIYRTARGWLFPYVRSRVMPGEFHPLIAYLFTEWKCNLDCHYCWAFDNRVKGMTEEVARRSMDWLHGTGCRVLALMGGEPLLRPQFVHKVIDYAARRGFWVYLPTNARLLRPDVIDRVADAGVATVNFAVDAVDEKPGLPKALKPVRKHFNYLCKRQYKYGYSIFFNMNICRNNHDDIRKLTEIAHDNGIATDYHVNESPMLEQPQFQHGRENETFIRPEDWPRVDELIDWIIAKKRAGYRMVDSVQRLEEMRAFMRGQVEPWGCRAGQNSLIIRVDGTLAPCFPMYSASYDWGTIEAHKFHTAQLAEMKKTCERHCFSTLNSILAFAYKDAKTITYALRGGATHDLIHSTAGWGF